MRSTAAGGWCPPDFAPAIPVVLASRSGTLVENVRDAITTVPRTRLRTVPAPADAIPLLADSNLVLILVHLACFDDVIGSEHLLRATASLGRQVSVVAIGEDDQVEWGLALLRKGALNFLERPLDLGRLTALVDALTVRVRQLPSAAPVAAPVQSYLTPDGDYLYCPTSAMGRVMDQVRRVAPVDTSVLIQGETGTGKTRLARVIHEASPRRGEPFLAVNCAALSAALIESELFGHVKGAFTGADRDREGKFAAAAGGTLLLDEVDALPPDLQAKLLRVVEDRVFEPVGSNRSEASRSRLIAACNKPLDQEVAAGRFRADLFFRLNVVSFELPPLRARMEGFAAMVERFVVEFSARAGRPITGLAPEAFAALQAYQWPGNIRELRNAIERAVALRPEGEIELDDLPDTVRAGVDVGPASDLGDLGPVSTPAPKSTLSAAKELAESARILAALQRTNNNRLRAAAELGISRMTLYKKLHRYGLFHTTF